MHTKSLDRLEEQILDLASRIDFQNQIEVIH